MGSNDPEDDEPDLGRAVIEDLVRAVFPTLSDTSRQPDPAAPTPSPEDREADVQGTAGVAAEATPVPVIDLGLEPASGRITGFLLAAALVVLVLAAAVAYGDPGPVTLGLVAALVVVVLGLWRSRGRRRTPTVVVTGSRLEISRNGGRHVFDLSRRDHPVDVIGLPGERSWRVLIHRRGMRPYVVDASMVDPETFLRVLHAQRSEVHYRPR